MRYIGHLKKRSRTIPLIVINIETKKKKISGRSRRMNMKT